MEKITKIEEVFDYEVDGQPRYDYDGFVITTDERQIKFLISNDRCCCENFGHLASLDDLNQFIGAELHSVGVVDTSLCTSKLDERSIATEECVFVNLETSAGQCQFTVYNSHNGYYGHNVLFMVGNEKSTSTL